MLFIFQTFSVLFWTYLYCTLKLIVPFSSCVPYCRIIFMKLYRIAILIRIENFGSAYPMQKSWLYHWLQQSHRQYQNIFSNLERTPTSCLNVGCFSIHLIFWVICSSTCYQKIKSIIGDGERKYIGYER